MPEGIKILMLEDVEEDVGLVARILKKEGLEFTIHRVDTREEFVQAVADFVPDVVLSDHALPQFNSIEAFKICKSKGLTIPFILVTGTVSEEFAVNILKQGADDYVLKSNLSRLPSAILQSLSRRRAEHDKVKAHEEVVIQNKELSKINKELDAFVYSVSHNLRSPLLSVLGLVNLAKKEGESIPSLTRYFEMMERSVHKLDDTLKEILAYSRNNRNEIKVEKIDLKKLLNECFEQLNYVPGSQTIHKEISIQGDVVLYSDAQRLSVVMTNLISNTINYRDFSKKQNILRIQVSTFRDQVEIMVDDNGVGIGPEYLPKVFDMFYRANERSEGAGLGLYIAREVVHRLDGTLELTSRVNEGTTVKITLPNRRPKM